ITTGASVITVRDRWENILRETKAKAALDRVLEEYIPKRRWFGGKAKGLKSVTVDEAITIPSKGDTTILTLIKVEYIQDEAETYLLPLSFVAADESALGDLLHLAIARIEIPSKNRNGILYDAVGNA